ncbi:antibiotic biosynthesis monooxygenase [Candidatus Accumulibacter sp. ACC007]|uniref:antibiotic biosynthesis monooxygenase n=1 Tax=Candidatus Accumulibacter sp. ACC007 TaxID=2823333 RepID=UPI0025BE10BB|nr:antibiotic biosynthesis monooxygenase [Candidatus Accumulibacter sp. ACC007]
MTPMQEPDPGRDYQTIAGHLAPVAFPWDSTRALELALFRTFAATRFGGLLHGSVPGGRRARDERDEQEVERMTTRMMARLTARAGNQTALATVLRKLCGASRAQDGCLGYEGCHNQSPMHASSWRSSH